MLTQKYRHLTFLFPRSESFKLGNPYKIQVRFHPGGKKDCLEAGCEVAKKLIPKTKAPIQPLSPNQVKSASAASSSSNSSAAQVPPVPSVPQIKPSDTTFVSTTDNPQGQNMVVYPQPHNTTSNKEFVAGTNFINTEPVNTIIDDNT
jgi:hypothetical protein